MAITKWNLTFLIHHLNSSQEDQFFIELIDEISQSNISENINLSLLVNIKQDFGIFSNLVSDIQKIDSETALILEYDFCSKKFILVTQVSNCNFSYQPNLEKLLGKLTKLNDAKNIIITWDHGAGLCFMPRNIQNDQTRSVLFNGFTAFSLIHELAEFNLLKKKVPKLMSVDEFSDALKKNFKSKCEVLVMMNCYMLVYDNLLSLYKNFNNIIAGEATVSFNGYNYALLIESLGNCNNIEELIPNIVESSGQTGRDNLDISANFGLKLSRFWQLNILFNLLLVSVFLKKDNYKILAERKKIADFVAYGYQGNNPYQLIDFVKVLEILSKCNVFSKYIAFYIIRLYKKRIYPNSFVGDIMKNERYNLQGLSMVFPESKDKSKTDALYQLFYIEKLYKTSFLKKSLWPIFLKSIFS